MGRRIHRHPPADRVRNSGHPRRGRSVLRAIFAELNQATTPTAPQRIVRPCWPANPMPIRRNWATGGMFSWRTSTIWWSIIASPWPMVMVSGMRPREWEQVARALTRRPLVLIRTMSPRSSSLRCASWESFFMWRKTPHVVGARLLIAALHATWAMPSQSIPAGVSMPAGASRRFFSWIKEFSSLR